MILGPGRSCFNSSGRPSPVCGFGSYRLDFSAVELLRVDEGLCVQCMHTGPYDDEPAIIDAMRAFAAERGYAPDFSEARLHHEIYLSDARKCAPEKLKTVIRHPIKLI